MTEYENINKAKPLSRHVEEAVEQYFTDMEETKVERLYCKVISEVEKSLLKVVMDKMNWNQSEAAKTLGINRNTLRKKLHDYNMLN